MEKGVSKRTQNPTATTHESDARQTAKGYYRMSHFPTIPTIEKVYNEVIQGDNMNIDDWKALLWVCSVVFSLNEQQVRAELQIALDQQPSTISRSQAIRVIRANHMGRIEEVHAELRRQGLQLP